MSLLSQNKRILNAAFFEVKIFKRFKIAERFVEMTKELGAQFFQNFGEVSEAEEIIFINKYFKHYLKTIKEICKRKWKWA